ncbi:MAG: beta-ketoacyl synthase chain length factor [Planctomycetota bacterium]
MSGCEVAIAGYGLWLPHHASAAAWAARTPAAEECKPVGLAFDKVNRRRASPFGRAIGDAAEEAMAMAGVDAASTAIVVGSSIGEAATMIGLLDTMWRTREPMSPAAFTVSVHNAASGILSISKKNTGYVTSLAADHDTPAAALLEGVGLVAAGHPAVLVVCADEASPRHLLADAAHWDQLAAAVVLVPAGAGPGRVRLVMPEAGPATVAPPEFGGLCGRNPQVGLADLVDAVMRGASGVLRLDRGDGRGLRAGLLPGRPA